MAQTELLKRSSIPARRRFISGMGALLALPTGAGAVDGDRNPDVAYGRGGGGGPRLKRKSLPATDASALPEIPGLTMAIGRQCPCQRKILVPAATRSVSTRSATTRRGDRHNAFTRSPPAPVSTHGRLFQAMQFSRSCPKGSQSPRVASKSGRFPLSQSCQPRSKTACGVGTSMSSHAVGPFGAPDFLRAPMLERTQWLHFAHHLNHSPTSQRSREFVLLKTDGIVATRQGSPRPTRWTADGGIARSLCRGARRLKRS